MAFTPPWAPHAGAADCFNRPTAIDMAATATAGGSAVAFTAVDGEVVTFNEYSKATFTGTDSNWCMRPTTGATVTSDTLCAPAQSSPR
jgi:hypothetical protein